jgi:voltage-gated potassium channel Kch
MRPLLDIVGIRSRGVRPEAESAEAPRLVLLGFHRIASALLADLQRLHGDLLPHTLVIDTNTSVHDRITRYGAHVAYGDIGSVDVLRHAGVAAAEVIVSTVPDELLKGTSNEQLVRQIRQLAANAVIIANCTRVSQVAALRAAGADHVFRAPTEVALGVLPAIYAALNANLPQFVESLEEEHGRLEARAEVLD